jgi:nitrous oxidase accessory protein NosD
VKGNSSGTVEKNVIHGKGSGIALSSTKTYHVYENIIENLGSGIAYYGNVSKSQVYNNSIAHNLYGVYINPETNGKDNSFFSNNLIDNKQQVKIPYGFPDPPLAKDVIFWDNGFVGNYWSDYRVRYPFVVQNSTPAVTYESAYVIAGNNIDYYPLQQEVVINRYIDR